MTIFKEIKVNHFENANQSTNNYFQLILFKAMILLGLEIIEWLAVLVGCASLKKSYKK